MAEIVFNFEQYNGQLAKACMKRLRKAADVIYTETKARCPVGTISRPAVNGKAWTERVPGTLKKSIRVTEKRGDEGIEGRDIRIIAGNYKAYYALQTEYGKGGWKGGAKPFMRPALRKTKSEVQSILENG